jgi:hypothetical protein
MAELGKPGVRDAIIASSDQAAAVAMMLQVNAVPDPGVILEHVNLVLNGRISPWLLWEKHPVALLATAILALAFLLMLKRLLFGSRQRIVVQQGPGYAGRGGRR